MANDCPCIPCVPPKRCPTCHATCPEFATWREKKDAKHAVIVYEKNKANINDDYFCNAVVKIKKLLKIKK